jgi:hypothetical protein
MQYMGDVGSDFEVYCNDDITVDEIKKFVTVPLYQNVSHAYMLFS